jgi:anti-sigma factor RsiW
VNCKKVQRWLPLMVGKDLSPSKISSIKAHLEKCPECQQEFDSYSLALEKTKEWLEKDRKEWLESEWQRTVQKAVKEKRSVISPLAPWPFKKAWAFALMGVLAVGLTLLFVIKPFYLGEGIAPDSELLSRTQAQIVRSAFQESQQEVVKMTMVLPESGQKIVWFFDKNFELEVKE